MTHTLALALLAFSTIIARPSTAHAQGTAFTYQGRLNSNGSPANGSYDLTFSLYDSLSGGNLTSGPLTNSPVVISNGLFSVVLDFGTVFFGADTWLQIGVRTTGNGVFSPLVPRQQITPTPYAITAEYLAGVIANNNLGSSSDTVGGGSGNFSDGGGSVVGGGFYNTSAGGSSTVGGGYENVASALAATVGGGEFNFATTKFATVAGGLDNTALAPGAFVGGGGTDGTLFGGNSATGNASTVDGGLGNTNTSNYGTLCGGAYNYCWTMGYETIVGGSHNYCSGDHATICGGGVNLAAGSYSFAAGGHAQAVNNGAFVWSDDTGTVTASTANNQFVARASGGFVFYTGTGTGGASLGAGATSWSAISDRNAKKNFQPVDGGTVLAKLAAIPIEQWNYKWENDADVPNIGPMAQDFKHAFFPGRDDKSISTLEFDGVELAAIQGLNQKLSEQEAALKTKDSAIQELRQAVAELQQTVRKIMVKTQE